MKLIECVINFSAGKDNEKVNKVLEGVLVGNTSLLHVDSGKAADRTVVTLAGELSAVRATARKLIESSIKYIDLNDYEGNHPCIGALDICPFIPLKNCTIADCVILASEFGKEIAKDFNLPVFLYGKAAMSPARMMQSWFRKGGLAGLKTRITEDCKPDFGQKEIHPTAGATIIGARDILIAYNINLETDDVSVAKEIAAMIRTQQPKKKEIAEPEIVESEDVELDIESEPSDSEPEDLSKEDAEILSVKAEVVPDPIESLQALQAIGWQVPELGCVQVSTNIINFRITPMHVVYEKVKEAAERLGVKVTGSELVGLVPELALVAAGRHYAGKEFKSGAEYIELGIRELGLSERGTFDPDKQILDYVLKNQKLMRSTDRIY